MDKRTILAFVLIAAVFLTWSLFFSPKTPPPAADNQGARGDSGQTTLPAPAQPPLTAQPPQQRLGERYSRNLEGDQRYITVEGPLYKAILNTRGGLLARFELKNYKTWYGAPVQLISDSAGFPGELGVTFTSRDGRQITTEDLIYQIDAPASVTLGENDSVVVTARLLLGGNQGTVVPDSILAIADSALRSAAADAWMKDPVNVAAFTKDAPLIEKRFVFRGNSYGIGFDVAMRNMAQEMGQNNFVLSWNKGLKYQEHNSVGESGSAKTFVVSNEELNEVNAGDVGKAVEQKFTGPIDWVGTHVKYFGVALIPQQPLPAATATITGYAIGADSSGLVESYGMKLNLPVSGGNASQNFTLFLGPLEYGILSDFKLQAMLDIGARFIIRPIGEFFMLPIFRFLHQFIGNYGIVIIVFSVLIRLLLWPLSVPQIKSSRRMQLLQPEITKLREKFKDDPQKQQMETMSLYREYGINPVGGCLPMVLQLPILYALWGTLSSAIELRQAGFALWIHDLSIPDVVTQLPFTIPLLGDKLSGLALIMGATLFIQQSMMITDPKQKAMIYFMPILLTLAFNHLPSGLNLYYLTFNILSIGQQVYMTKFSKNTLTLEQMRVEAKGKKKGWLAQKLEEAQKMAEVQTRGGGAPGGGKVDGRTPVEPRSRKPKA